jgi:hypothetical protein
LQTLTEELDEGAAAQGVRAPQQCRPEPRGSVQDVVFSPEKLFRQNCFTKTVLPKLFCQNCILIKLFWQNCFG